MSSTHDSITAEICVGFRPFTTSVGNGLDGRDTVELVVDDVDVVVVVVAGGNGGGGSDVTVVFAPFKREKNDPPKCQHDLSNFMSRFFFF